MSSGRRTSRFRARAGTRARGRPPRGPRGRGSEPGRTRCGSTLDLLLAGDERPTPLDVCRSGATWPRGVTTRPRRAGRCRCLGDAGGRSSRAACSVSRDRSSGRLREPLTLHAEALGLVRVLRAAQQELELLLELGVTQALGAPDAEGPREIGDVARLRDLEERRRGGGQPVAVECAGVERVEQDLRVTRWRCRRRGPIRLLALDGERLDEGCPVVARLRRTWLRGERLDERRSLWRARPRLESRCALGAGRRRRRSCMSARRRLHHAGVPGDLRARWIAAERGDHLVRRGDTGAEAAVAEEAERAADRGGLGVLDRIVAVGAAATDEQARRARGLTAEVRLHRDLAELLAGYWIVLELRRLDDELLALRHVLVDGHQHATVDGHVGQLDVRLDVAVTALADLLPLADGHEEAAVLRIGLLQRVEHEPLGVVPRLADEYVDLFLGQDGLVEAPAALKRPAGWEVANGGASGRRGRGHRRWLLR